VSIRGHNKDHLKELAQPVAAVPSPSPLTEHAVDDPLHFWTHHPTDPVEVDLRVFRDGEHENPMGKGGQWAGTFSGRPALIEELAPVIREIIDYLTSDTVSNYTSMLRTWWRQFDLIESAVTGASAPLTKVKTVADISEIHRQSAFDAGMARHPFSTFVRVVNVVRSAKGFSRLHWRAPENPEPIRHLPPQWHIDQIRFALKRRWFEAVHRWQKAESLLAGQEPQDDEEARLLKNYQRFQAIVEATGHPRPGISELCPGGMTWSKFNYQGFFVDDMLRGFYPDGMDIKVAFHLCLASTGWNPAVLLGLDVNEPIVEPHPKDPTRYLMRGYKVRGRSEQFTEGLYKSEGSAGVIVQNLIQRTAPLREQVRKDIDRLRSQYETLRANGAEKQELRQIKKQVVRLERAARSPWIYASTVRSRSVECLSKKSYHRGFSRVAGASFLAELVGRINEKQPPDRQVSVLTAGDFRDAFAAYAYQISGGMVLFVMKALGHKRLRTTQTYLDNTLLNAESQRLYRAVSSSLWHEIKIHGRVDPTIIAKWSRDGAVTDVERGRLIDYRSLRRSRIGVGCKTPTNPPKRVAPTFRADGKALCPVHRCTLCFEGAVIFPDSLNGLCKRTAELRFLRERMSVSAFLESSFGEELENAELALKLFDPHESKELLAQWEHRIACGEHRVIEFEGVQERSE
jgi:hypothetical protein